MGDAATYSCVYEPVGGKAKSGNIYPLKVKQYLCPSVYMLYSWNINLALSLFLGFGYLSKSNLTRSTKVWSICGGLNKKFIRMLFFMLSMLLIHKLLLGSTAFSPGS